MEVKLCEMSGVRSTEEATEEADEEEPGVSEQKQKPHTKMLGKRNFKRKNISAKMEKFYCQSTIPTFHAAILLRSATLSFKTQ